MTIVIFVVVSILSGFTQQMVTNRFAGSKNVAINLAESKIEEYLKFPASHMKLGEVDYVVEKNKKLDPVRDDPNQEGQFRRTAVVNDVGTMKEIRVTVEYGKHGARYPFRVVLTSMKGG